MAWDSPLGIVLLVLGGGLVGYRAIYLVWRLDGMRRIRQAGPRRLFATRHRIWREPTPADLADLRFGPGGEASRPSPPFRFVQEHGDGSWPCVTVRDAARRLWRVKWGDEARPEVFGVRLAWALGYFSEVTHYVATGRIEEVGELTRARDCIAADGRFAHARFELEDPSVRMLFEAHSWSWDDNPFVGTPQLQGLKILSMLLSNWDTKDQRDVARGSNTAIFEHRLSRFRVEARYLISDWGGALGRWGSTPVTRSRWDVDGFEAQTPGFVTGAENGVVGFAYQGQRTAEIARNITVGDAAWFYGYAGRLREGALREGLLASGASYDEARRFAQALLDRIEQIGRAAGCHRIAAAS